jgi:hypothetical protein
MKTPRIWTQKMPWMWSSYIRIPGTRHRIYLWKQADRAGMSWEPMK